MSSLLAFAIDQVEGRIAAQAISAEVVVGLAEYVHHLAFVQLQVIPVKAFYALIQSVVRVTVSHFVLTAHLRNLADSVQN